MSASPTTIPSPNYVELVRFLLQPFLTAPDRLKVDAEFSHAHTRILIRVALDEAEDLGRVFGRGGRNIKAVGTALEGMAQVAGNSARLEVFGAAIEPAAQAVNHRRPTPPSGSRPKPTLKPKI